MWTGSVAASKWNARNDWIRVTIVAASRVMQRLSAGVRRQAYVECTFKLCRPTVTSELLGTT
jgi:hypothetical protein